MSIRCKVCNASKIAINQTEFSDIWECKTCGNMLDTQGHVINHK